MPISLRPWTVEEVAPLFHLSIKRTREKAAQLGAYRIDGTRRWLWTTAEVSRRTGLSEEELVKHRKA